MCPKSPDVSFPGGPLTIDAHCHVFNGTDLQISAFLSKVAVRQDSAMGMGARVLGDVLQALAWSFAPDGTTERDELRKIALALKSCDQGAEQRELAALRQKAYSTGRGQLQEGVKNSNQFRSLQDKTRGMDLTFLEALRRAQAEAIRQIDALPESVEDYRAMRGAQTLSALSSGGRSAAGMIDFVLQNFQYRYVSVHDYLRTYNQPGVRVVDLMLPSLVDYDWWLAMGQPTRTTLEMQVKVMREISILTGGRVHAFVPFDPLRQVASDLGHGQRCAST